MKEELNLTAEDEAALYETDAQENSEKKKELQKYKQSYKNILWIDDRDDNQASGDLSEEEAGLNWMKYWLIKEDMCMQIEQVSLFREAVNRITTRCTQYDLVIFDINLKNGFDDIFDEDKKSLEKTFKNYHIPFTYEEVDKDIAGYLLYRLLLAVGYPLKRMLIFSGHESMKTAQEALCGIVFDDNNFLSKKKRKINVETYFDKEKNNYYRIRRLVCQACCYWIDRLSDENELKKTENIPFNKLYYTREVNNRYKPLKTAIISDAFINMLEHIRMLFPVTCPSTPKKVYYQAMRTLSVFHEESARIQDIGKIKNSNQEYKVSDFANLKRFHSCIRNFRNWSSHNLMETELMAEQFVLLFCIGVRTYFSWETESDLNEELLPYEELYDFNRSENSDSSVFSIVSSVWHEIHKQLNSLIKQNNQNYYHFIYYSDLEEAVRKLGEQNGCPDMGRFLFIPIWCPKPKTGMKQEYGSKEQKRDFCIKYELTDKDCIKFYNDSHAKKTSVRSCFMDYCYQWIKI